MDKIGEAEVDKIRTVLSKDINKGGTWIIGNESHNNGEPPAHVPPAVYAHLYQGYHDLIKSLDPTAKIVMGALLYLDYQDTADMNDVVRNPVAYLEQFLNTLPNRQYDPDIYNLHFYPDERKQGTGAIASTNIDQARRFKSYLEQTDPGKPIWVTEFGVDWNIWNATRWASEDYLYSRTSEYMDRMIEAFQTENLVQKWFWFIGPYEEMWHGSNLIGPDGQPTRLGQHYLELKQRYEPIPSPSPSPSPTPSPSPSPSLIPSQSPSPSPSSSPQPLVGDINNDGKVDRTDFAIFLTAFGSNNSSADLNSDNRVDIFDYNLLNQNFSILNK